MCVNVVDLWDLSQQRKSLFFHVSYVSLRLLFFLEKATKDLYVCFFILSWDNLHSWCLQRRKREHNGLLLKKLWYPWVNVVFFQSCCQHLGANIQPPSKSSNPFSNPFLCWKEFVPKTFSTWNVQVKSKPGLYTQQQERICAVLYGVS